MNPQPKSVVISLDGNTYSLLKNYLDNNQIDSTKGLGLLKSKGIFIPNTTITPSLTAPSHIAIATGSSAANNDINANSFHLIDSPFNSNISGFGAPIGGYDALNPDPKDSLNPTAEPLWVKLINNGRKVVAATFPGADGVDVKVPGLTNSPIIQPKNERTVDYTVPFGAFAGVSAKGFSLTKTDFSAAPTTTTTQLTTAGKVFYSPVLQKTTSLDTFASGGVNYDIRVAALDTTNDNVINYDTLVFFDQTQGIKPTPFSLPSTGPAYVKASDKVSQPFYLEGSSSKAGLGFYVSNLTSDLSTVNISRSSANSIPRPAESPGVIANVDDINNNVGFWAPQADFRIPERLSPGYEKFSDLELEAIYEDQVKSFVDYQTKVIQRSIQQNPDADLVLGYIEQPDGSEHQFLLTDPRQASDFTNPNSIGAGQDAAKVQRYKDYTLNAYKIANDSVQKIIDTVGVDSNGTPNSNIIVVSDHGFAPFHTAVSINNILTSAGFDSTKVRAINSGPAVNIYINLIGREPNGTVTPAEYVVLQQKVIDTLKNLKDTNPNYAPGGVSVFDKVYNRPVGANPTATDIIKASNEFIGQDSGDVFALLNLGYNFDGTQATPVKRLGDDQTATTPVFSVPNFYGAHGYDPALPQMQAIFAAAGPSFDPTVIKQTSIRNIDVAPTVEKILGVQPAATVQGQAIQGVKTATAFSGSVPTIKGLNFIGQATFPAQSVSVNDSIGQATTVGGLSGITYDAAKNVFYSISDDRKSNANEPGQPTRFYKLNIDLSAGSLDNSKVVFTGVTYLRKADGSQYLPQSTDTEDIALTNNGTVFVSSEGQVDAAGQIRVSPFVNEFRLSDGQLLRTLPIPTKFLPDANTSAAQTRGTYDNLAFESVAITPNQRTLYTASENALIQDGQRTSFPGSDAKNPTGVGRSRILKFNLENNQATGEFLYLVDPTAVAPSKTPAGVENFSTAGLVALTAVDDFGNMLALERSFSSVPANTPNSPETGNVIKLYQINVGDATDISSINSLSSLSAADFAKIKPAQKTLLLNFNDLKLPTGLDNVEGVTFGPTVNGKPTIVLVADDNFNKTPSGNTDANTFNQSQFSQILAFTVDLGLNPTIPTAATLTKNADNDVFTLKGGSGKPKLQVSLTGRNSNLVNELGVFTVDDATGKIDGIAPGAAGYAEKALVRGRVILSAIANTPNGFNPNEIGRSLEFADGNNVRFYLVKNSTTDSVLSGKTPSSNVLFSSATTEKVTDLGNGNFTLAFEDGSGAADFQDLVVKIQPSNQALPLGVGLQGKQEGEVLDLRGISGNVKASFSVNREAAFNNLVGFYKVDDETGLIGNLKPSDAGYAQQAIRQRIADIDLRVDNQGTSVFDNKQLAGGSILAPFMIANGATIEQVINNQTNNVYFAYLGANSDKVDHIRLLGNNTFGFEDLAGGGDFDYNDVIVRANLTAIA